VSGKYALISAEKANHTISTMCRLVGVSRSGFYAWEERDASASVRRREELKSMIAYEFDRSECTYGYRRVHAALRRKGVAVGDDLVRRLMRELGLMPVQVKRRRGLTVLNCQALPLPDLLRRDFTASALGEKMIGDITQIDTAEGPLYLATTIDFFSRAVIGWAIDEHYPAGLVAAAIRMAAGRVSLPEGAIFHSDRGSQYMSHEFAETLAVYGIRQSVGRASSCFVNSAAESFFGKLKTENVHHHKFATRAEARREVIRFIEGFYNQRRLHSSIGYRPPVEVLDEWSMNQTDA
jgi:transposase InsO family protein